MNNILYNNEFEYKTNNINIINKDNESVNKIKTLLRHRHMNLKGRKSIFKICDNYFEIFHLERVKIARE